MIIPLLASQLEKTIKRELVQGKVVDNVDPINKSRVRVSIPGITDSIPTQFLPWYPVLSKSSNSSADVPPINSRVIVEYNTIYNSIVYGCLSSTTPN
jgi:hypothetical protein